MNPWISFLGVCLPVGGWSLGTLPPSPDGVKSLVLYWQHILAIISGTFCAVSSVHMIWFASTREGDWKTRMRNGTCPCRGQTGGRQGGGRTRSTSGPESKMRLCLSDIEAWPSGDQAESGHISRMGRTPFLCLFLFGANLSLLYYVCRFWCLVGPPLHEEGIKSHGDMAHFVERLSIILDVLGSVSSPI